MTTPYEPYLDWINGQPDRMLSLITDWANINSGTGNLAGLACFSATLEKEFAVLGGTTERIALPPHRTIDSRGKFVDTALGDALRIRKRPEAPVRVFLGIHMDTVYAVDHPFQHVTRVDERTPGGPVLRGPGVADAKGGLCVMLIAIEALERSPIADRIGWEVLINPDEEIGSPGSADLLGMSARRNQIGMVYEPAFADGALVGQRKGSGNFDAIIRGRPAHAGRDFHAGRSAIQAAAAMTVALGELNHGDGEVTVNVGRIDGGGPSNIVPDLAIVRFNVRVPTPESQRQITAELDRIVRQISRRDGIGIELHGGFRSPPKVVDPLTQSLFESVAECGRDLGLNLAWRSSGGVSDGNKLAAAGLPVIDTLGPRGGNLHSPEEFLFINSLTERAKLSALLLMKLGSGEIRAPSAAQTLPP
jgi:glutamate carboxypeptidase